MKKYEVTIHFYWKSKDRSQAWIEVGEYVAKRMRNLATIHAISHQTFKSDVIAINEPIRDLS